MGIVYLKTPTVRHIITDREDLFPDLTWRLTLGEDGWGDPDAWMERLENAGEPYVFLVNGERIQWHPKWGTLRMIGKDVIRRDKWVICPKCLGATTGIVGLKCAECGNKMVDTPLFPAKEKPLAALADDEILAEYVELYTAEELEIIDEYV